MRRRRFFLGLIAPASLFALVGALATLQYHWLGQVSEAERSDLRDSLDRHAREFTDDFDREISGVFTGLQPAPNQFDAATFAKQVDDWKASARFPELIKGIYLARTGEKDIFLLRFDPARRAFEPTIWPASLEPVRARLRPALDRVAPPVANPGTVFTWSTPPPIFADVPAVVIGVPATIENREPQHPPPNVSGGTNSVFVTLEPYQRLIAELDGAYIKQTMLPQIAARHFPDTGSDRYRVAVVDSRGDALITRGLAEGQHIDPGTADVISGFFSMPRIETARTTAFAVGGVRGAGGGRVDVLTTDTLRSTAGVMQQFSMVVEQRDKSGAARGTAPSIRMTAGSGWRILLQHQAGSLDAAVAAVRRRNLWLSFGILGVLVTGVALIVINARRSERLAAQQMDFVATVSHELRTPLAVIRSAAQNLSAGVIHDATQARRYGDLIEGEGRRLTDMVEQVLEYAGVSGNQRGVAARPVNVAALVDDVVASCQPLLEAEKFEVAVDVPPDLPDILADADAIRRVLHNLVNNALKYAADGRWIGIAARPGTSRAGKDVQIAVSDRGRGIAPQDLAHIFEPFYRGQNAVERQIHGSGLGLSLVRRIAEAHRGRVTVTSQHGVGSVFTLHLPVAPTQAAAHSIGEPAPGSAGPSA